MTGTAHPIELPEIDRYYLLQQLVRTTREQTRGAHLQRDVATRAKLAQSTISNIESMASRPYTVRREHLLQLAVWGLNVPVSTADAWLALHDPAGQPLTAEEVRRFYRRRRPPPTADDLRAAIIGLVAEVVENRQHVEIEAHRLGLDVPSTSRWLTAANFLALEDSERGQLTAAYLMRSIERQPGQRMEIGRLPKVLTAPRQLVERFDGFLESPPSDPSLRRELRQVTLDRLDQFRERLPTFGARMLLSYRAVQHYVTSREQSARSLNQRRLHIRELIDLIERTPLKVGLLATIPAPELLLNLRALLIRQVRNWPTWAVTDVLEPWGLPRPERRFRLSDLFQSWGPRYFYFTSSLVELRYFVEFERAWAALPPIARESASIVPLLTEWLDGMVDSRRSLQLADALGLRPPGGSPERPA